MRALLELEWDDDVDMVSARLGRDVGHDGERVVPTTEEYAAYLRVTERIMATWHAGSVVDRNS